MDAYFDREASNPFHSSGATDFRDNGSGDGLNIDNSGNRSVVRRRSYQNFYMTSY